MPKLVQYAKGRFVPAKIITGMSVYSKQSQETDSNGNYPVVYRIAIDLDVKETSKNVVYSDPYQTEQEALNFLHTLNVE